MTSEDGEEYGEAEGLYIVVPNPEPEKTKALIEKIKAAPYERTTPPEHNMMEVFQIFMKVS